ncbi:MAG: hypothetical protein ACK4Q5_12855 [Saprospiraceae bacterium]
MLNEGSNRGFMPARKRWILFPLFFIAAALLLGGAVMFLWNAILPEVIGARPLSYPHALGLLVLCRILFGGFRGGRPGGNHAAFDPRGRWMSMSAEERAKFKAAWQERCRKKED